MCVLIPFLPAVTAHKARHVNDLLERKTGCGRSLEPRFRKKSHLGGGIKKQHLLDAVLF